MDKREGLWKGVDDLDLAILNSLHWFNNNRLHSSLGYVPQVEFEEQHYRQNAALQQPLPGQLALHDAVVSADDLMCRCGDGLTCRCPALRIMAWAAPGAG